MVNRTATQTRAPAVSILRGTPASPTNPCDGHHMGNCRWRRSCCALPPHRAPCRTRFDPGRPGLHVAQDRWFVCTGVAAAAAHGTDSARERECSSFLYEFHIGDVQIVVLVLQAGTLVAPEVRATCGRAALPFALWTPGAGTLPGHAAGLPLAQPREADAVVAPVERGQVAPAAGGVGADGGLPAHWGGGPAVFEFDVGGEQAPGGVARATGCSRWCPIAQTPALQLPARRQA